MEARREVNVFRVASGTRHTGARRVRAPRRSNAKPSSIRSPARRSRARAACRVGIALVLAFPGAGCGNGDVRSPTAPDPTPTSVPVAQGLDIVGAPPDGLLIGSKVWLQAHGTYSDGTRKIEAAAWTSSDPGVASVDAEGAVRAHAAGVSTITATAGDRRATVTVEVRPPDHDETFWREFAFDDYECRTPAACRDTGRKYRDLEKRVLWRLPTPSPDFIPAGGQPGSGSRRSDPGDDSSRGSAIDRGTVCWSDRRRAARRAEAETGRRDDYHRGDQGRAVTGGSHLPGSDIGVRDREGEGRRSERVHCARHAPSIEPDAVPDHARDRPRPRLLAHAQRRRRHVWAPQPQTRSEVLTPRAAPRTLRLHATARRHVLRDRPRRVRPATVAARTVTLRSRWNRRRLVQCPVREVSSPRTSPEPSRLR